MKKRILSLLLAFLMLVSISPVFTYAEDGAEPDPIPTEAPTASPCPSCSAIDCDKEHKVCDKCSTVDCTADHSNWCEICKVDNCGQTHIARLDESASGPACNCNAAEGEAHAATCPAYTCPDCGAAEWHESCPEDQEPDETPTEPEVCAECGETPCTCEDEGQQSPDYSGDIGKYAVLNRNLSTYTAYDGTSEFPYYPEDFTDDTVFTISNWRWDAEKNQLWYQLEFVRGSTQGSFGTWTSGTWILQNGSNGNSLIFVSRCGACGEFNCATEHKWCEVCEDYDCGKDHTTTEPEAPGLSHPESGIVISGTTFPEDVKVSVSPADVGALFGRYDIPVSDKVFGLDISLIQDGEDYQPGTSVKVKVPVNAAAGTKIGLIHNHDGAVSLMGMTEVLPDGTVEFYTDRFSEFAGFTVDFHYNGNDYSIAGLTSIKLSELFVALEIDRDAAKVIDVTYSDPSQIKVTQIDGDWQLESLKAFVTEETLEITFYDGEIIAIDVTDWQYDYDTTNGEEYDVGYWNTDGQANWTLHINRDNLPMTIYLTRTAGSLGWNYPSGSQYISTSESNRRLTVKLASYIPLGHNIVNIDATVGGRVYIDFFENISVTYNSGGVVTTSMPSGTTEKTYGTITISSTRPTADGYTFTNWLGSDGKYYTPGATVTVDGDVSFTAQWSPISYSVSFNGNGATGGSMSNQSFKFGTAQNLNANAYKREYTVTYNTNGGNAIAAATAKATFNGWEDRGSIVYKGTTYSYTTFDAPFYANKYGDLMNAFGYNKYNLLNHWVTYTVNGSETRIARGDAPGLYPNGASVSNLATTNGYTVPLYANWTLGSVTLPKPEKEDHIFRGWYSDAALTKFVGDAGDSYPPTGNVTLYAKWEENYEEFTISYNLNGGTLPESKTNPESYTKKDSFTLNNPTKTGYTFAGWTGTGLSDKTLNVTISEGSTGARSYTANWTAKTDAAYTVHYYLEDSTTKLQADKVVTGATFGQEYTESAAEIDGYVLADGQESSKKVTAAYSNNEIAFYYKAVEPQYTVSYSYTGDVPAGAPAAPVDNNRYIAGASVNVAAAPTPAPDGYTFSGWTADGVTVNANGQFTMPDGSVTFKGRWNTVDYIITYDLDGGSLPSGVTQQTYDVTQALELMSMPEKQGYKFTGWKLKQPAGSWNGDIYEAKQAISAGQYGNITLVAQWDDQYRYVLSFDANTTDQVSNMPTPIDTDWIDADEYSFALPAGPTRDNYDFMGWAASPDAAADQVLSEYTMEGNANGTVSGELYAVWQRQTGDLKLCFNGNDSSPAIVTVSGQGLNITVLLTKAETLLKDLPTGSYTITAQSGNASYIASVSSPNPQVEKGQTAVVDITVGSKGLNWFTAFFRVKNECN